MVKRANSTFIAIGVGQGDAFFFQKGDLTALIDGGKARDGFTEQFRRVTKRNGLDILVCTHNDADHALGVLGLLQSGLVCKEVWLPGSWTARLEDILLNQSDFFTQLIDGVGKTDLSGEILPPFLETLGETLARNERQELEEDERDTSLGDLWKALERAGTIPDMFWSSFLFWGPIELWPAPLLMAKAAQDQKSLSLLFEAVAAANRIRKIALTAYHSGARIRWFEHHQSICRGGRPQFLLPVNAREIDRFRRRRWSALEYLALTTANRESLVFQAPSTGRDAPVLFTADSDVSFSQSIGWKDGMIITAPHHGSEANAGAYQRFDRETTNGTQATWVRSDGRYTSRPGKSYLKARGNRFCTLCRGSQFPKQDVCLSVFCSVFSTKWHSGTTRRCSCV